MVHLHQDPGNSSLRRATTHEYHIAYGQIWLFVVPENVFFHSHSYRFGCGTIILLYYYRLCGGGGGDKEHELYLCCEADAIREQINVIVRMFAIYYINYVHKPNVINFILLCLASPFHSQYMCGTHSQRICYYIFQCVAYGLLKQFFILFSFVSVAVWFLVVEQWQSQGIAPPDATCFGYQHLANVCRPCCLLTTKMVNGEWITVEHSITRSQLE